jgi:hypothetical protein
MLLSKNRKVKNKLFMKLERKNIIVLLLLAASVSISRDQNRNPMVYHLETGSRLWIDGSATLGSYECRTVAIYGIGEVDTNTINKEYSNSTTNNFNSNVRIKVLIKFFDCGNPIMNEDMYTALKADQDSIIQYKLIKTSVLYDSTVYNGLFGLRTIGYLSIAGVSRQDTIDVEIKSLQERKFEIIGHINLSMIDYNITPPSAFLGLIKAHEELTVNFDLIAAPKNEHYSGNTSRTFLDY